MCKTNKSKDDIICVCRSDPPSSTEGTLTWSDAGPLLFTEPGHISGNILPSPYGLLSFDV